jgi:hypothetical protein
MNFKELTAWVEANPGKSILIGGGLVIFLLWIFGAFSKSSAGDGGQSSLAAAYYAAEAQQAVVGGQIQMANISANASTAQELIKANAAQAINATNATAATTINSQQGNVLMDVSSKQLTLGLNNNATLLAGQQNNNATALEALKAGIAGQETITALNTVIPQEIAVTGGFGNFYLPGGQTLSVNTGASFSPDWYKAQGFAPNVANALALADKGQPPNFPGFPVDFGGPLVPQLSG